MKICSKCQIPQPLENFKNNQTKKDGKDSQCKLCVKQYCEENKEKILLHQKQYREQNKEKIAETKKQWCNNNKERCRLKEKQYREENEEQILLREKRWRDNNKEKIALKNKQWCENNKEILALKRKKRSQNPNRKLSVKNAFHKRRTSLRQGDVTNDQLKELLDNSTNCFYCNDPLVLKETHIDHYIPLAKGGLHTITNLRIACKKCNLQKSNKLPEEFINIKRFAETGADREMCFDLERELEKAYLKYVDEVCE